MRGESMGTSDYQLLELIFRGIDLDTLRANDPSITQERLESLLAKLRSKLKPPRGKLSVYTDGASRGNPGRAGIGVVICDKGHKVLEEVGEYIGETTNNVAEYKALITGLKKALDYRAGEVEVLSDSELLVKQVKGEYRVKAQTILPLYMEVKKLLERLPKWAIRHIPREENTRADALANLAIDRHKSALGG